MLRNAGRYEFEKQGINNARVGKNAHPRAFMQLQPADNLFVNHAVLEFGELRAVPTSCGADKVAGDTL